MRSEPTEAIRKAKIDSMQPVATASIHDLLPVAKKFPERTAANGTRLAAINLGSENRPRSTVETEHRSRASRRHAPPAKPRDEVQLPADSIRLRVGKLNTHAKDKAVQNKGSQKKNETEVFYQLRNRNQGFPLAQLIGRTNFGLFPIAGYIVNG